MRKIIQIIVLMACPLLANAQLTGDGTFTNPWSGTLSGDATWSGTKFINGDITVDNETLTISQGAIIIFLSENADLIITGTGCLKALGSPGNMITFTSDDDNDGNFGETGERWGHIYFNAPSESIASVIDYCIIEYGDVHTFTDYQGYGGAVHANFSNLVISNCILRNNYAYWGGAVFVNQNKNAAITRCYIYNNKSSRAGGGVYCWNGSGSVIQNCIFDSNQCLEPSVSYYTGGGLACQTNASTKVVNCTFVNNTSTRTEGQALLLYSSANARVVNSIFWGSPQNQIYLYGTSAANVIHSAYRGITYSSGTPVNPVLLNSDNDASDGPNFTATDGSDWSIKFVSPCRDAGVNSLTGVTIPSTDYTGNNRIGTTDIGAYEVQYSRWKITAGSTDWNTAGNWDGGIPNSTRDVIIPTSASNYPTASPGADFTIGSGKQMIIEQGARVTLNNLTNNGIIKLNHNASGFASLILNSYTRGTGGSEEIQLYLTGGGSELNEDYKWHYISSPVLSLPTDPFTSLTIDLAQFVESRPSTSLLQGWVAYDGYVYSTGQYDGPQFSSLTPGKGYNFWDDVNNTVTFGGSFNTSDVTVPIGYTIGTPPTMHGFNLLGNPFSSGLDWDDIIDGVYFPYPANTSKGLYFTRDNIQCSYIAGVGVPSDVTGIIPPMQGFFNKTYSTGNSITLPAAARTHDNIHARYKGKTIIPLVRLAIFEDTISNDETVIRFDEEAKTGLDYDFDAIKMFLSSRKTTIHTSSGGTDYSINGQPFPESLLEIPVVVNVVSAGTHKISATQLQGLDDYDISLTDKTTGFTANLKTTPVMTFSAASGLINDRFILKIDISTGTEDIFASDNTFNIYHSFDHINIQTLADDWDGKTGSVKVLDVSGKTVSALRNAGFSKNSVTRVGAPNVKGLYFIEIKSGMMKYVGKVVIK